MLQMTLIEISLTALVGFQTERNQAREGKRSTSW